MGPRGDLGFSEKKKFAPAWNRTTIPRSYSTYLRRYTGAVISAAGKERSWPILPFYCQIFPAGTEGKQREIVRTEI